MDSWELTPGVSTVTFALPLECTAVEGPLWSTGDEVPMEGVLEARAGPPVEGNISEIKAAVQSGTMDAMWREQIEKRIGVCLTAFALYWSQATTASHDGEAVV